MPADATDITLAYYDVNARVFADATRDVEFSATRRRFTSLLAPGACILDLGCGSGRDAKAFLDDGFDVAAWDGSAELCRLATELTGLPVRHARFQDLDASCAFDGIWACSSILHLPKDQLAPVLRAMERALRPGGVIYTSFKHGTFEGVRNGRHFTDFTEPAFRDFVASATTLSIEDLWVSRDVRPGRDSEEWLNVLLRRQRA